MSRHSLSALSGKTFPGFHAATLGSAWAFPICSTVSWGNPQADLHNQGRPNKEVVHLSQRHIFEQEKLHRCSRALRVPVLHGNTWGPQNGAPQTLRAPAKSVWRGWGAPGCLHFPATKQRGVCCNKAALFNATFCPITNVVQKSVRTSICLPFVLSETSVSMPPPLPPYSYPVSS